MFSLVFIQQYYKWNWVFYWMAFSYMRLYLGQSSLLIGFADRVWTINANMETYVGVM